MEMKKVAENFSVEQMAELSQDQLFKIQGGAGWHSRTKVLIKGYSTYDQCGGDVVAEYEEKIFE